MIFARNIEPVADSYGYGYIPDSPISKLVVRVTGADVICQVTEDDNQPPKFENPNETELLLEVGFHSLSPITAFSAFRMRNAIAAQTTKGTVTFRAYA